jgi:hypothetical protein
MTSAGSGLKLKAYEGGSTMSVLRPTITAARTLRTILDSSRIPDRPANQNLIPAISVYHEDLCIRDTHMTAIEICCTCLTV